MSRKKFKHVLVILGGTSGERAVSLESGKACIKALKSKKYKVSTFDPKIRNFNLIDKRKFSLNGDKSFYHVGGIVGSTQTIIFLSLMFIFPRYFNEIALIFSILCMAGTLERIYYGYKILN